MRKFLAKKRSFAPPQTAKRLSMDSGQVTVELILLMVFSITLAQFVMNSIKNNGALERFASVPNKAIACMLENGNWMVELGSAPRPNCERSRTRHPNTYGRRWSWDPE